MFLIRKRFRFEAAHQLERCPSDASKECSETIHGHSYVVDVILRAPRLDESRMVLDFGALASIIQTLWDELDHSLLLPPGLMTTYTGLLTGKIVNIGGNPTAELLAVHMGSSEFGVRNPDRNRR